MTADVDLLPCPFCGSTEPIVAEPPEILPLSFQIICCGSGCNAVVESRTLARAKLMWNRRANVAQQHGQAKDCHCATCTCAPGMTPAVRFDTSPAAQEGAVRDHLIALGWTPPGAQQPAAEAQGGGDVVQRLRGVLQHAKMGNSYLISQDLIHKAIGAITAPPSAPVGVDMERFREPVVLWGKAYEYDRHGREAVVERRKPIVDELLAIIDAAIDQQPEARGVVDEGSRSVTRQLLHWNGIPVHVTGTVTTSPGNWSLIDATQHQEPKS